MADFQKAKKLPSILNSPKMRLSAPCPTPGGKGKWATLQYDIYKNNPRIVVDTKDDSLKNQDNGWGKITAAMDPVIFGVYLAMIGQTLANPAEHKNKIENSNYSYENNQKSQDITPQNDVWVGRDKDGVIYVAVVSKKANFPVIRFPFGFSDQRFVKLFHGDGTPFTKAEVSDIVARAYLESLTTVMAQLLAVNYEEPPPPQFGGNRNGGGGGNFQRRDNGGGNYNAAPSPAADDLGADLPF